MKHLTPLSLLMVCVLASCSNQPNDSGSSDDAADDTTACVANSDCEDGLFCNGSETCQEGACEGGELPCNAPSECYEQQNVCSTPLDVIQNATWLVIWGSSTSGYLDGAVASAFAISPEQLATNAHVTEAIKDFFQTHAYADALVVQHETGTIRTTTRVWSHFDYDPGAPPLTTPDIGIIEVDSAATPYLSLASEERVQNLEVFDELSLCGYPGSVTQQVDILDSILAGGGLRPRATCLQGTVSVLRPFDPSDPATPENSFLIQHSIPTSHGTSGSPILDVVGDVVAINFAGLGDFSGGVGRGQLCHPQRQALRAHGAR